MRTRKKLNIAIFLFTLLPLYGCSNALYFYETEKVSLTIEARPDSSQPVQGNLGLKQRVAIVTPGKEPGNKELDNEALSAISSFNFQIIPETGIIFDPVLIQTAFITGEAASQLDSQETADAAQAIVLEDSYTNDVAGKILRKFWKPDEKNIDKNNEDKIKQWLKNNKYDPDTLTYFLRAKNHSKTRQEAIKSLGLDN